MLPRFIIFSLIICPTLSYYEAGRDKKFTFTLPPKNTQFIPVNMHMLWHRRQIWQRLSAGIKRHKSTTEERPALTVLSKTKLQDITIGKEIPEEIIVRENGECSGQSWLSDHLVCYTGRKRRCSERTEQFIAVKREITMQSASVWEKNRNLNNDDECCAVWLPWISNMSSVLSEGEQRTQLRGRLWFLPNSSLEAWCLAKLYSKWTIPNEKVTGFNKKKVWKQLKKTQSYFFI